MYDQPETGMDREQPLDERLLQSMHETLETAEKQAEYHRQEMHRHGRIAAAARAALEQLQMKQPMPDGINTRGSVQAYS